MNMFVQPFPPTPVPVHPSFTRLFVSLGVGVGLVTLTLCSAIDAPVLAMGFGGALMLAFVGLVMHEVNRLLADDDDDDGAR